MTATIAPETAAPEPPEPLEASSELADIVEDVEASAKARRRRRQKTALALVVYVALALLAFYPYGPFNTSHLPGAIKHSPAGADPLQMVWFLSWTPYALTHGLNLFQTTRFEYPTGINLADNTTVPFLGLIAWPITANLGPVAAFNFLVRLCLALDGVAMFLVLRRYTSSVLAAFAGGLLYAFGPYTAAQVLHIDLIFVPIPPLLVLCMDELVKRQKMRPWRLGLILGLLGAIELYVSPDILAGCGLMLGVAFIGLGIRFRHKIRQRIGYMAKALAVAATVFLASTGFMLWEMVIGPRHLAGAVIPAKNLQAFRANVLGPFLPTSNQLGVPHFLADVANNFVDRNLSENGTYIGIPLMIVLAVILHRLWNDDRVRTFFWLGVAAFVVSLGSVLTIGTHSTHIPLPESVFQWIPLLDNTIPARFSLYVLLFGSMILAIGLDRLWLARDGARTAAPRLGPRWRRLLGRRLGGDTRAAKRVRVAIVVAAVMVSLLPTAPFLQRRTPWPSSFQSAIQQLIKPGTAVVSYPYATPIHPAAMVWQAEDSFKFDLVGGYANTSDNGRDSRWPVTLYPRYPQDLLAYSLLGDQFPPPRRPEHVDYGQMRAFLAKYHIGAVVYWAGASNPVAAYRYIRKSLGRPTSQGSGWAIWLPHHGRWLPPRPHHK
ncbi:MAG: hypothetical protein ACRD0Z_16135 [Acidimicrobiales bacterium]